MRFSSVAMPGVLSLTGFLFLGMFSQYSLPRIENAYYYTKDQAPVPTDLPLNIRTQGERLIAGFSLIAGPVAPSRYRLFADDCVESVIVNGQTLDDPQLPFCDDKGREFDMGGLLRHGWNEVEAVMADHGGVAKFHMEVAQSDVVRNMVYAAFLIWLGISAIAFTVALKLNMRDFAVAAVAGGGVVLRAFYSMLTLYSIRAYDWEGHIDYVQYVMKYFAMPPAQAGWEYYQPPLYYFLAAAWMHVSGALGRTAVFFADLQKFSFLLSACTLITGIWIGYRLFPRRRDEVLLLLFAAFLSTFPGLVFFSSRVNNDALFQVMSFLSLAFLLEFWRSGNGRVWIIGSVIIGLGLLTKSNMLPMVVVACAVILFRSATPYLTKLRLGGLGLLWMTALSGWLFVQRFLIEGETFIVGNRLHHVLGVPNDMSHLFSFNPMRMFSFPFSNSWGVAEEREFFLEYLFKSAFFGEWNHGEDYRTLAVAILICAMLVLVMVAMGIVRELRRPDAYTFPLVFTLVTLLVSAFLYRYISPYSSNQDFRFIPVVVIPLGYFALRGFRVMPLLLRHAVLALFVACISANTILSVMLPLYS